MVLTSNIIFDALNAGLLTVIEYLAEHVITCLIPAFFIAGAIAALVKKDAILKYFGPKVAKYKSYTVASVSGTILAVCSCTILPLFAGIYKKGSGIGPATTFLFSGPAINILAIIYTAQVLGVDIGIARAVFAITMSILVGLIMAALFGKKDETERKELKIVPGPAEERSKPRWVIPAFFVLMVAILLIGASKMDWVPKLGIVYFLTIGVAVLLIYYFQKEEVTDWGMETWDLTKKIFPILIAGTFVVGVFAFFVPPETFRPYLGDNGIGANLLASIMGALMYMPTLLEVPIVGGTLGYTSGVMASGPALALLLSGPTTSLPSVIVLYKIMGMKKTLVYWSLVVVMSAVAGMIFGFIVG
ncbi:MAG: permease [Methanomassiliicoccales archaeon]|nr:permease [Methanomassiliicoccales archaeon]